MPHAIASPEDGRQGLRPSGTLLLGPGQHGKELADAIRDHGSELSVVENWPLPRLLDPSERQTHAWEWFRPLQHAAWAAWNRMPWLQRHVTPRELEARVVDAFAAAHLRPCGFLWAWSQMSLATMRRARDLGVPSVLLEHPTSHVDTVARLIEDERQRWTPELPSVYSTVPPLLRSRMRAECDLADRIVVLSSFARQSFRLAGFSEDKLLTLWLGVDVGLFQPVVPKRHSQGRVLFVGRLELRKGIQYLCEAANLLGSRHIEFLLAGPLLPEGRLVLRRTGRANIRALGHIRRVDLPALFQSADLVVLPSVEDAYGLVILEAMASGTPVVASDHTGGPDIITDGEDGFVVPARDSNALKDRIDWCLSNPTRLSAMGETARATVLARYTLAHYRTQVKCLLDQLGGEA